MSHMYCMHVKKTGGFDCPAISSKTITTDVSDQKCHKRMQTQPLHLLPLLSQSANYPHLSWQKIILTRSLLTPIADPYHASPDFFQRNAWQGLMDFITLGALTGWCQNCFKTSSVKHNFKLLLSMAEEEMEVTPWNHSRKKVAAKAWWCCGYVQLERCL